jgi:Tfp pilus assembly protein PilX
MKQKGSTLAISLIMLIVLTLLAVSAIRSGTTNLRIAGNMQQHEELNAAADQAIEQVISTNFTTAPAATTVNVDLNGDASVVYSVAVAKPGCISNKDLTNADLDPTNPLDQVCMTSGASQNTGIINSGGTGGSTTSWCSQQEWDIQSTATNNSTGATATQHQGVSLRVQAGTSC